jgi:hypothetical protein
MTAEVGAGQSTEDINAVADPAWLSRIHSETSAEPFLDDDGAVVIPVVSGRGPCSRTHRLTAPSSSLPSAHTRPV